MPSQAVRASRDHHAALDVELDAGPLAAGWTDQRWTLARIRDLVARKFKVQYTIPGIWYLLRRRGWTCQLGARRAIERDDGSVDHSRGKGAATERRISRGCRVASPSRRATPGQ